MRALTRTILLIAVPVLLGACGKPGRQNRCSGASCSDKVPRELMYGFLNAGSVDDANLILQDQWPIPRFKPIQLPPPQQLTWTENPYADKYWRFIFYSFRGAVPLLAAWEQTHDPRYRDKLVDFMLAFAAKGQGTEFAVDRHTTAFRAMVLTNAYKKLDAAQALSDNERQALRDLIQATAEFMMDPAHFEPNFNHGINEANALLLVAENFREMPNSGGYGQLARQRLESLMSTAVGTDGVANEMSPYYHFYMIDALWQTLRWGRDNDISVSPNIAPTLEGMIHYGVYIMHPDGGVPLVAACLARDVPKYDPPVFDDIRSSHPEFDFVMSRGAAGSQPPDRLILFPSAGHAILRSDFDAAKWTEQTHVFFDVSPYRTAQSQMDALNVVIYGAGRTLVTDSGLYTYLAGPDRSYFIGTRAHNTVVVDGLDQNPGSAVPMLSRSTPTWLYQSGYHQLYADVTHRRGVLLLQRDLVVVFDKLEGTLPHTFEQTWHFQPDIDVAVGGTGSALGSDAKSPVVAIHQGLPTGAPTTLKGVEAPVVDGWYSDAYGVKQPSISLKYPQTGTGTEYVTLVASGKYAVEGATLRASATPTGFDATVCGPNARYHVTVTSLANAGEDILVDSSASCP